MVNIKEDNKIVTQEQAKSILRIAYSKRNALQEVSKIFGPIKQKFSKESIDMAIEHMNKNSNKYSEHLKNAVADVFVNQLKTTKKPLKSLDSLTKNTDVGKDLENFMKKNFISSKSDESPIGKAVSIKESGVKISTSRGSR